MTQTLGDKILSECENQSAEEFKQKHGSDPKMSAVPYTTMRTTLMLRGMLDKYLSTATLGKILENLQSGEMG